MMKVRGRYNAAVTAARRKQILDAAAACFRREGFRGASMADISQTAGLSTGHIYHYFENKAAIVEAIVERSRSHDQVRVEPIKSADDVIRAIVRVLTEEAMNRDDAAEPVLLLESLAEASHNPRVARICRECGVSLQANLRKILEAGQAQGVVDCGADIGRIGLLLDIFLCGFVVHRALHPDVDAADIESLLCFSAKAFFVPAKRDRRNAREDS